MSPGTASARFQLSAADSISPVAIQHPDDIYGNRLSSQPYVGLRCFSTRWITVYGPPDWFNWPAILGLISLDVVGVPFAIFLLWQVVRWARGFRSS
jgi:hypothetical protein